ncbi:MAG: hypothetical protein D6691_08700 [Candidatus Hydrogenedentota bacterium]|nr:MAG: hypothetical protein D6691_08700 [Candidatus Hydrogenedentota bacterium]GIX44133.1 MAG: hypothetical protein KatS3mg130_0541 [Candidatus Sumerlaea sp.]
MGAINFSRKWSNLFGLVFVGAAIVWSVVAIPCWSTSSQAPFSARGQGNAANTSRSGKGTHPALPSVRLGDIAPLDLSKLPQLPTGERYVAVVNGTTITERRFAAELALAIEQQQFSQIPSPTTSDEAAGLRAALAQPVLDQLIANVLIKQLAERRRVSVADAEVERAVNQTNEKLPPGRKLQDLAVSYGLTFDEIKDTFRALLLAAKIEDTFGRDERDPTPEELRNFLKSHPEANTPNEEIRVSAILLKLPNQATTETRERTRRLAERIVQELRGGADFCELAMNYSQDRASAPKCGDLGYVSRGKMDPEFDKVAFSLPIGKISDVVATPRGFYIILVREKHPTSARQAYRQFKKREAYLRWFEEEKRKAKIEKFL